MGWQPLKKLKTFTVLTNAYLVYNSIHKLLRYSMPRQSIMLVKIDWLIDYCLSVSLLIRRFEGSHA